MAIDAPDNALSTSSASLRPVRYLAAALTGVFVTSFPAVILVASLPQIAADLGAEERDMSWVITAPILISSVLLPLLGRLGDTYGHRRLFLIGLTVSGTASALCAVAWDVPSLVALRTLSQSAGMSTHPAAIALLMAAYRGEARNKSLGYWAFVGGGSPAIGLAFGGPMVAFAGWRAIFVVQACAAVVGVLFARFGLEETERRPVRSLDLAGGLALMSAVGALLLVLDRGRHWGWTSGAIATCAVTSVVSGVVFGLIERRSRNPMLPLAHLRNPGFRAPMVVESLVQASNMGVFFLVPFILHGQFDQDAAGIAAWMLPLPIGMTAFSPVGGRLTWAIGCRATSLIGSSTLCASIVLLGLATRERSMTILFVAFVIQGAANGLLRPANAASLSQVLDDGAMGVGMATLRMISQVGTALGITIAVATSEPDGSGGAITAALVLGIAGVVASSRLTRAHERVRTT